MNYIPMHPGVTVITSGIGSRIPVKLQAGERRLMHGQSRLTSCKYDCVKAALVNALFGLRWKSAAAHMKCVVDADSEVSTRLGELGVLLQSTEKVTRSVFNGRVKREIGCGDRGSPFEVLADKKSGVFVVRPHQEYHS